MKDIVIKISNYLLKSVVMDRKPLKNITNFNIAKKLIK